MMIEATGKIERKPFIAEEYFCETHGAAHAHNATAEWTPDNHFSAMLCNSCARAHRRTVLIDNPAYRAQFDGHNDDYSDLIGGIG